jgi:hypothetical protein
MHHNYEQWTENIQGNRDNTSALLSAFFNKPSRNVTDFTGHRPCPLDCRDLACAVRPTPPQNLRKGIACLCPSTSSKYLLAFDNSRCLMACAASLVFLKCTRKSDPLALHAFVGLSGSRAYFTCGTALRQSFYNITDLLAIPTREKHDIPRLNKSTDQPLSNQDSPGVSQKPKEKK